MGAVYQYARPAVPQKYFSVDGVATFVHHTGATTLPDEPPDVSRGSAVVCLHGSGGNGAVFTPLLEALAARHSPLAFDQPGHGRSGGLDSLGSLARMAAFTGAVVAKLGLREPVLLGHSLGGAVALEAALSWPEPPRALVLLGSADRFPALPDGALEALQDVVAGRARRPFDRSAWSPSTPDDVVRRGFLEDLKTDPRTTLGDLQAVPRDDALSERIDALAVPTLILVGADEGAGLREAAEGLTARLSRARFQAIEGAGHMLPFEQPGPVAEATEAFLAELDR